MKAQATARVDAVVASSTAAGAASEDAAAASEREARVRYQTRYKLGLRLLMQAAGEVTAAAAAQVRSALPRCCSCCNYCRSCCCWWCCCCWRGASSPCVGCARPCGTSPRSASPSAERDDTSPCGNVAREAMQSSCGVVMQSPCCTRL
jgi:hypothetical protein